MKLSPLFTWRSAIASPESALSPRDRHVALTLSLHMSERGDSCYPSMETLAGETGYAISTVREALRALSESGWLIREITSGRGRSNRYTATVPENRREPVVSSEGPENRREPGTDQPENRREPGTEDVLPEDVKTTPPIVPPAAEIAKRSDWVVTKVEGRDLPFDRLAELTGVQEGSQRMKEVAVALNGSKGHPGIREQFYRGLVRADLESGNGVAFEHDLVAEIEQRCYWYRQKLPGAILTPTALAKWWSDLATLNAPAQRRYGRGVTTQEIYDATRGRT